MSEFGGLEPPQPNPSSQTQPAGEFRQWLEVAAPAIAQNKISDVPCGDCNACCRASYFIHVAPEDTQALAVIPKELLFTAPGAPPGFQLMGFSEQGHCPMLQDGRCSIYASRPRACRSYDCRVFAATDIPAGGSEKADVNSQVLRWQFSYADTQSQLAHAATKKIAQLLSSCTDVFTDTDPDFDPQAPSQAARFALANYPRLLAIHEQLKASGQTLSDEALARELVKGKD